MRNAWFGNAGKSARWIGLLASFCFLCFVAIPASAQFDTGTITGTITDSSGAVIPGATVMILDVGTGRQVTVTTDRRGGFNASALPFGTYNVTARAKGFIVSTAQGIILNVGAKVNVNLTLAVASSTTTVTVTGTQTSVDTQSSKAGMTLSSQQVENLPVNGRDVSNFLEIAPGSVASTGYFQGSINGLENIFTGLNITVDGQTSSRGDISGFLNTEGQEAAHVTRSSIDSIQEIDFTNNGYSAEMGYSLGPQMNIITKGGANQFHGTLYEYFRNEALDTHDYFETGPKQPLRLNQFGGNFSGPLVRNKLFFFVNYEGGREHITTLAPLNHTLSAYARSQFVSSMQPVLDQMAPLPAGCTAIPAPASCAYPNSDSGTAGGANMVYDPTSLPTILRSDTGSARLDYNISDKDRMMFRYNINDSLTNYTYGANIGQTSPQALTTQLLKFEETHIFDPSLLNEFSIGIDRFYSNTESDTPQPYYGIGGFFTDLGSLPGSNTFNQINANTISEISDNVSKVMGSDTLHAGIQIRLNQQNTFLKQEQTYYYGSFGDLEHNNPFVLSKIGYPGFLGLRDSNWGFYVQNNWQATRKLVLNVGLRYDYNTTWRENHNNITNFDINTQSFASPNQAPYSAPKSDFAPRVGLAFDPFGTGKTVFHAYGGLFYLPMQLSFGLSSNIPEYASYNVNAFDAFFGGYSIAFPSPNPPLAPGTQVVYSFPGHPHDPYATNWLFGMQQELPEHVIATVNYAGNNTHHMQAGVSFAAINLNPANTVTAIPQSYSGFSSENYMGDVLGSNYNALQLQLQRTVGRLYAEVNYTWSHEFDNNVNVFSGYSDPFNPSLDRSSGDIDVRNNLTASALYHFGDLEGASKLRRETLGGWQVSSIVQTRSGLPTNITLVSGFFGNPMRPNYVPGKSPYLSSIKWPNQSYNINAFAVPPGYDGTWGTNLGDVGRNALRGPAFFQWDMSGIKNFPLTKALRMQFRTDIFNILNHPNFANPDGGICLSVNPAVGATPASCTSNPDFGRASSTVAGQSGGIVGNGTSRQVQFSLKLLF